MNGSIRFVYDLRIIRSKGKSGIFIFNHTYILEQRYWIFISYFHVYLDILIFVIIFTSHRVIPVSCISYHYPEQITYNMFSGIVEKPASPIPFLA